MNLSKFLFEDLNRNDARETARIRSELSGCLTKSLASSSAEFWPYHLISFTVVTCQGLAACLGLAVFRTPQQAAGDSQQTTPEKWDWYFRTAVKYKIYITHTHIYDIKTEPRVLILGKAKSKCPGWFWTPHVPTTVLNLLSSYLSLSSGCGCRLWSCQAWLKD